MLTRQQHVIQAWLKLLSTDTSEIPSIIKMPPTSSNIRINTQVNNINPYDLLSEAGSFVSAYQLVSNNTGFPVQLKGRFENNRYKAIMVFVDHHSRLSYAHIHQGMTSNQKIKAKRNFEA